MIVRGNSVTCLELWRSMDSAESSAQNASSFDMEVSHIESASYRKKTFKVIALHYELWIFPGLFDDGKSFHSAVETVLRGSDPKEVEVSGKNQGHWESLKNVFKDISDVITVEERISHPYLCYKGVTDCVLSLDGTPCLVEWKTSSTRKDTMDALYDNPLQVAAYIGAVNFDQKFEEKNVQLGMGAVVVAYSTGEPASVLVFDTNLLRKYWTQWLRRLQQYWQLAAAEKTLPRREK